MVYEPREDSFLLKKHVKTYAHGKVLDMGTGSGIQAKVAASTAQSVIAADIDPDAMQKDSDYIRFVQSDLFESLGTDCFDLIIFNPPYLPDDIRTKDPALDGGRHGYELACRFLDHANAYLKREGKILLLFSSLSNIDKINECIMRNCMKFTQIDSLKLDFERLFVYLIEKSSLLKRLESMHVSVVQFLAKGHRGIIFTGIQDNRKISIKTQNPKSGAVGRIDNEIRILKIVNKYNIGPRLLFTGEDFFAYEFVDGILFVDYIKKNARAQVIRVLDDLLNQLHELDMLGINKEEMHHPVKHIIVGDSVVLIDFERARFTEKPQNVTSFCQFLLHLKNPLAKSGIIVRKDELIDLAKQYKESRDINIIINYLR